VLGGAVSIAANVAHSYVPPAAAAATWRPQTGAVISAVVWPLFLFAAIELLAKVAWPGGWRWVAIRYIGLLPVAAVAALVSYRHLSGLLHFYGEERVVYVLGPLAVDGLMVMATGALVALGARARLQPAPAPAADMAGDMAASPFRPRAAKGAPQAARAVAFAERNPTASTTVIADETGVSPRTVRRALATRGAPA